MLLVKTYWKLISRLLFRKSHMVAEEISLQNSRTYSPNTGSLTLPLRRLSASGIKPPWVSTRTRLNLQCGLLQRDVGSLGVTTLTSTVLWPDQSFGSTYITRCTGFLMSFRHLFLRIKRGPRFKTPMTAVPMSGSAVSLEWILRPTGAKKTPTAGVFGLYTSTIMGISQRDHGTRAVWGSKRTVPCQPTAAFGLESMSATSARALKRMRPGPHSFLIIAKVLLHRVLRGRTTPSVPMFGRYSEPRPRHAQVF